MKKIFFWGILLSFISEVFSQERVVNFGLTAHQEESTLPKSKVEVKWPVRLPHVHRKTKLEPVSENDFLLKDGWELAEASKVIASMESIFDEKLNTENWYNATVPGTVLTTLVDRGVFPDPNFGLNNLSIPDSLCRMQWWYRIPFTIPNKFLEKKTLILFDGINYRAEVWLNGHQLGRIDGAFSRGEFDATRYIHQDRTNILAVHIYPPNNPGIPHEQSLRAGTGMNGGQLCLDGPTFIASEGWDWMPGIRDRNIGIWQNVHIKFIDDVRIIDPMIITDLPLPDTTRAAITVKTGVKNYSSKEIKITIEGTIENVIFEKEIKLAGNDFVVIEFSPQEFPQLNFENPRLWWPNNYGRQELYWLNLKVKKLDGTVADVKNVRFGIRELSYELTIATPEKNRWRVELNPISVFKNGKPVIDNVNRQYIENGMCLPKLREEVDTCLFRKLTNDGMDHYLVFRVNGQRIFCKGGNWGMDNAMKKTSREYLEPYFRLHRDANLNMIRNWTGQSTEEAFYDLCDEYGMLVWNDFWLTTQGYNLGVNDYELFMANARDVIRRFRNHPSIAIWNARNEGFAPKYIDERLNAFIAVADGTRYYQANSTHMNLRPSGPWHYYSDPSVYYTEKASGFNTEMGTPSVPIAESILKMMSHEDSWPISDAWYYHDFHYGQKDYVNAICSKYGKVENLYDFCKKAQVINYESHRAMFESWNSKMWNNTSGLLVWMSHSAWPSTVWQIYSWDYETHGSYFGVKKACEPIHVQMNLHDGKIVAINTTLNELPDATIILSIYDLKGKCLISQSKTLNISANKLTEVFFLELPENLPNVYMVRVEMKNRKGALVSVNDYWKTANGCKNFQEFNDLPEALLNAMILKIDESDKVFVKLNNQSNVPALFIKLNLLDKLSGERILPAFFSDGYFNLMPGESRVISVQGNIKFNTVISAQGYNVTQQNLIFFSKEKKKETKAEN